MKHVTSVTRLTHVPARAENILAKGQMIANIARGVASAQELSDLLRKQDTFDN